MRIAQLSDFHYTHLTCNPLRLFSKRILATLNWLGSRKKEFNEAQVEVLPELLKELGVDMVLLGGDFSTTSLEEEFQKAKRFVSKLSQKWIAIPGNHDRYTKRSCITCRFYQHFAHAKTIQEPLDFFNLQEHRIEVHTLKKGWRLIALDTALATHPYSSEGVFSEKLQAYLEEVLALIPQEESILLFNHFPFFQNDTPRHNLRRGEALQKILEQHPRIRLYLHGHTHRQIVADVQTSRLPLVLDSGSCAQGNKGSWNLIDLTDEGCAVSTYAWENGWKKRRTEVFGFKRG